MQLLVPEVFVLVIKLEYVSAGVREWTDATKINTCVWLVTRLLYGYHLVDDCWVQFK